MKTSTLAATVLGLSCLALSAMAQQNPPATQGTTQTISPDQQSQAIIEKAVKHCVDVVHQFPADQMEAQFFKRFDAFYNPASGRVENNGYLNGDLPPVYQFNKCMASQGVPLK
jgi:hypothetical protein